MSIVDVTLSQVKELITASSAAPAFLWGPPGIGKSSLVHEVARSNQLGLIDLRVSQLDPTDLRGLPWVDKEKNRSHWAQPSFLPQEDVDGKNGILFLDELSSAPPLVQAACYQLVLDRKVGEYTLPEGWRILAAGNRLADRSVGYRLSQALANRFDHFNVLVDVEDWKSWAYQNQIDSTVISFVSFKGLTALMSFDPKNDDHAFATPRSWARASDKLKLNLSESLQFSAVASSIGVGMATEFMGYRKIVDNLPSMQQILFGNPGPVVKDLDLIHAVISGLITELINLQRQGSNDLENAIHAAIRYVQKMPAEYGAMMIHDLAKTSLAKEIRYNTSYVNWVTSNHHLLVS